MSRDMARWLGAISFRLNYLIKVHCAIQCITLASTAAGLLKPEHTIHVYALPPSINSSYFALDKEETLILFVMHALIQYFVASDNLSAVQASYLSCPIAGVSGRNEHEYVEHHLSGPATHLQYTPGAALIHHVLIRTFHTSTALESSHSFQSVPQCNF